MVGRSEKTYHCQTSNMSNRCRCSTSVSSVAKLRIGLKTQGGKENVVAAQSLSSSCNRVRHARPWPRRERWRRLVTDLIRKQAPRYRFLLRQDWLENIILMDSQCFMPDNGTHCRSTARSSRSFGIFAVSELGIMGRVMRPSAFVAKACDIALGLLWLAKDSNWFVRFPLDQTYATALQHVSSE